MSQGAVETVTIVGSNGDVRLVRIPSGRAHELLDRAEQDGSLDAREAIKWQDEKVHVKIQLGIALDFLEALLRYRLLLDFLPLPWWSKSTYI
jgi:DnaJ family protein C protein 13